jgi:broad specificity phosphatase PhoE
MFAVYVTHPQVAVDPRLPVPDWGLSTLGRARAEAAARLPWVRELARVVTSVERKARDTAAILAGAAGIEAEVWPDLHENDRSATGYLPPPDFEAAADAFFAHPARSFRGWETAEAAQARILNAVGAVLEGHPANRPLAIVGHGGVGTLLWLALSGRAIGRDADQPNGGGNLFAFGLRDRRPLSGWMRFETWDGVAGLAERKVNG